MKYPFVCECGNKEEISMPIKEYKPDGHYCSICGKEMTREIESLVCACSVDRTGDFYRAVN